MSSRIRVATIVFMAAALAGGAMAAEPDAKAKEAAAPAKAMDPVKVEETMPTPSGYRKMKRNGEDVYCKRSAKTGSKLKGNEVCLTAAELKTMRESSQEAMRDMQSAHGGDMPQNIGPPTADFSNGGY